ncbi:MAG TPA: hypothetical protein VHB20_19355 [Verrucomicrobiae bacterium]|jgi:hypothetical protein|nr:hypothetical protein [Verrucomicrobiae bacterium]
MTTSVSDKFSNLNDNLAHAAKVLARSKHCQQVFEAIYRGKKAVKTQADLRKATGLSRVRILQVTTKLFANNMIRREKIGGQFVYKKGSDLFFSQYRDKILNLARNGKNLAKLPTKVNPRPSNNGGVVIKVPAKSFTIKNVTIDDIGSFSKVKRISQGQPMRPIAENKFKNGVKKIIGEGGKFTDWGGEKNDLFSTKIRLNGKRISGAFAFKGKGKKGILKPKDFGKNGDQIQRLFQSDAELFMLQYWNQLDQSVFEQMRTFAIAKSAMTGEIVHFGIIDGDDTQRLMLAYPAAFKGK